MQDEAASLHSLGDNNLGALGHVAGETHLVECEGDIATDMDFAKSCNIKTSKEEETTII